MKIEIISNSDKDTIEFAKSVARAISDGSVLNLVGDLGAGKTTFTKGLALGMGCGETVTSPTFTILNEYLQGERNLFHFDFYRIEDPGELMELGFEEYFSSPNGVTVVEWAERAPQLLPNKYYEINFSKIDDDKRKITFEEIIK